MILNKSGNGDGQREKQAGPISPITYEAELRKEYWEEDA